MTFFLNGLEKLKTVAKSFKALTIITAPIKSKSCGTGCAYYIYFDFL